jgi:hypothetical protein
MSVSWSVRHHFEVEPAGHPADNETNYELGVGHAQPLTVSIPACVIAHTMP